MVRHLPLAAASYVERSANAPRGGWSENSLCVGRAASVRRHATASSWTRSEFAQALTTFATEAGAKVELKGYTSSLSAQDLPDDRNDIGLLTGTAECHRAMRRILGDMIGC